MPSLETLVGLALLAAPLVLLLVMVFTSSGMDNPPGYGYNDSPWWKPWGKKWWKD